MKRAHRLRRPDQFRRARHQGRTFAEPAVLVHVASGRRGRLRCGFVVGKRLGIAVRRNRMKRRLREAVRLLLPQISSGYDLVFMVRSPNIIDLPFLEVQALIEGLLRRAQIWRPQPAVDSALPPADEGLAPANQ